MCPTAGQTQPMRHANGIASTLSGFIGLNLVFHTFLGFAITRRCLPHIRLVDANFDHDQIPLSMPLSSSCLPLIMDIPTIFFVPQPLHDVLMLTMAISQILFIIMFIIMFRCRFLMLSCGTFKIIHIHCLILQVHRP